MMIATALLMPCDQERCRLDDANGRYLSGDIIERFRGLREDCRRRRYRFDPMKMAHPGKGERGQAWRTNPATEYQGAGRRWKR
jgi:hypothetical protein